MTFRVFDGFCKAGGAGEGYCRSGAEVVGMDIVPQPRNPREFRQGDVLEVDVDYLRTFDLLHFSPPCQGYTEMRAPGQRGAPRLIPRVRGLAKAAGVPYVIENVRAAKWDMVDPIRLRGDFFGLRAPEGCLQRERLFETSFPLQIKGFLVQPKPTNVPWIGVYGGHCRVRSQRLGGRGTNETGWLSRPHLELASELMDIDWMNMDELSEAIPPAYTQHIAEEFLKWRG